MRCAFVPFRFQRESFSSCVCGYSLGTASRLLVWDCELPRWRKALQKQDTQCKTSALLTSRNRGTDEEQEANKAAGDILWKYTRKRVPLGGAQLPWRAAAWGPPLGGEGLGIPHRQAHAGSGCCRVCVRANATVSVHSSIRKDPCKWNGRTAEHGDGAVCIPVSSFNPAARYRAPLTPAKVSSRNLSAETSRTVTGGWWMARFEMLHRAKASTTVWPGGQAPDGSLRNPAICTHSDASP
jgi:hypothetical protein